VRIAIEPAFLSAAKGGAAAFEPNSIQRGGSCLARQQNIARPTITQNGSAAAQKVAQERQWLKKRRQPMPDGQLVRFRPGRCRFGPSQNPGSGRRFGLKSRGDVLRTDGRSRDPLA
jgi:hypothetical protein